MWGNREPGPGNRRERGGDTGLGDSLGEGDDLRGDEVREDGAGEDLLEPGEVEPSLTGGWANNSLSLVSPVVHFSDNIKSMPNDKPLLGSMIDWLDVNFSVAVK